MCLMLPARILSIEGSQAVVEIGRARRTVSILPTPEARAGDWGLVSAGSLIRVVDPTVAMQIASAVGVATGANPTTSQLAGEQS